MIEPLIVGCADERLEIVPELGVNINVRDREDLKRRRVVTPSIHGALEQIAVPFIQRSPPVCALLQISNNGKKLRRST